LRHKPAIMPEAYADQIQEALAEARRDDMFEAALLVWHF
jgi:hypothetical protein